MSNYKDIAFEFNFNSISSRFIVEQKKSLKYKEFSEEELQKYFANIDNCMELITSVDVNKNVRGLSELFAIIEDTTCIEIIKYLQEIKFWDIIFPVINGYNTSLAVIAKSLRVIDSILKIAPRDIVYDFTTNEYLEFLFSKLSINLRIDYFIFCSLAYCMEANPRIYDYMIEKSWVDKIKQVYESIGCKLPSQKRCFDEEYDFEEDYDIDYSKCEIKMEVRIAWCSLIRFFIMIAEKKFCDMDPDSKNYYFQIFVKALEFDVTEYTSLEILPKLTSISPDIAIEVFSKPQTQKQLRALALHSEINKSSLALCIYRSFAAFQPQSPFTQDMIQVINNIFTEQKWEEMHKQLKYAIKLATKLLVDPELHPHILNEHLFMEIEYCLQQGTEITWEDISYILEMISVILINADNREYMEMILIRRIIVEKLCENTQNSDCLYIRFLIPAISQALKFSQSFGWNIVSKEDFRSMIEHDDIEEIQDEYEDLAQYCETIISILSD